MLFERARNRLWLAMLWLALVSAAPVMQENCSAEELKTSAPAEYAVKAAFIYNFIKFVEWPPGESSGDDIRLCILGDLPGTEDFKRLSGRQVKGKRMNALLLNGPDGTKGCDVLFVAGNQTGLLHEIIDFVGQRPTLTIGDTEGYARRGVMINMFVENKRIRFEINEKKARAAGLRISVKLLKLASMVYGSSPNEDQ